MVETTEALDNLEEIAAVPGLTGLFVGPVDLALALGGDGGSFGGSPRRRPGSGSCGSARGCRSRRAWRLALARVRASRMQPGSKRACSRSAAAMRPTGPRRASTASS